MKNHFSECIRPTPMLVVRTSDRFFYASLEDNPSARALIEMLNPAPLRLILQDEDGQAKTAPLPRTLPCSEETLTVKPGDLILCQGARMTLCCAVGQKSGAPIASISYAGEEALHRAFGDKSVRIEMYLEWSE